MRGAALASARVGRPSARPANRTSTRTHPHSNALPAVRCTRGQRVAHGLPPGQRKPSLQPSQVAPHRSHVQRLNQGHPARCFGSRPTIRALACSTIGVTRRAMGQSLAHRFAAALSAEMGGIKVASIGRSWGTRRSSCGHSVARPNTSIEGTPNIKLRLLSVAPHVER